MAKDCVKTGRVVRLEMMRKIWKTWLEERKNPGLPKRAENALKFVRFEMQKSKKLTKKRSFES